MEATIRMKQETVGRGAKAAHERRRPADAQGPESDARQGFRPWHFFVLMSLMAATVAVMMSRQPTPANLILISFTIMAAGLAGLGMYRTLAPLVSDAEANGGEPLGERSRAVLEREKMLVLRSIKELEFDRAMGKLSAGDFDEMASRLRSRAISLITQLDGDASGYREVIERELQARLGARRAPAVSPPAAPAATARAEEPGPPPVTSAPVAEGQAEAVLPSEATVLALFACDACGTRNDADALFCKRCGARFDTVGR